MLFHKREFEPESFHERKARDFSGFGIEYASDAVVFPFTSSNAGTEASK
jgi:hypothetical protein